MSLLGVSDSVALLPHGDKKPSGSRKHVKQPSLFLFEDIGGDQTESSRIIRSSTSTEMQSTNSGLVFAVVCILNDAMDHKHVL